MSKNFDTLVAPTGAGVVLAPGLNQHASDLAQPKRPQERKPCWHCGSTEPVAEPIDQWVADDTATHRATFAGRWISVMGCCGQVVV